jgi:hypothetical protein
MSLSGLAWSHLRLKEPWTSLRLFVEVLPRQLRIHDADEPEVEATLKGLRDASKALMKLPGPGSAQEAALQIEANELLSRYDTKNRLNIKAHTSETLPNKKAEQKRNRKQSGKQDQNGLGVGR